MIRSALRSVVAVLRPLTEQDWGRRAGRLDWTCRETGIHLAHDLIAYAGQVTSRADDGYLPLDLTVRDEATPTQIVTIIEASGELLARALDGADPGDRGWHWGPTDPGGFAALGANELLVHTWDITQGLGVSWDPPADEASAVVARLFPGQPDDLLWCTGRRFPFRENWTLKASTEG